MSSDETPNVPESRNTREAVREKAQQVQARQSRARVVRRIIIGLVAVVAVGAVGTAVTYAVTSSVAEPALSPGGLSDDGVVVQQVTGATIASAPDPDASSSEPTKAEADRTPEPEPTASEPVDIHIYVDYLSPGAGEFERANARQLSTWITEGAATVSYHPVSLLTANSNGTKYSLRAAGAAACVASFSSAQFYAFNHALLIDQPDVDTDGPSDVELADLAGAVGVEDPQRIRSCIEDEDYVSWAKDATSRALEGPLPGSEDLALSAAPMVVVNGEAYVGALDDPAEFSQFVLTIASDAYYAATEKAIPTPTATPTPSDSAAPAKK